MTFHYEKQQKSVERDLHLYKKEKEDKKKTDWELNNRTLLEFDEPSEVI